MVIYQLLQDHIVHFWVGILGSKVVSTTVVKNKEDYTLHAKWSCDTGYYLTSTSCTACPSGYTSDGGTGDIYKCYIDVSSGKYKTTPTGSTINNCAAGYYSSDHRSYYNDDDACSSCSAGKYASGTGNSTCSTCPSGYTSSSAAPGQDSCYKTLTATLNANGGSFSGSNPTCTLYYGSSSCTITFPTTEPTKSGYTFGGWSTSSSATSGTKAGNTTTISSNTTFYAAWATSYPEGDSNCSKTCDLVDGYKNEFGTASPNRTTVENSCGTDLGITCHVTQAKIYKCPKYAYSYVKDDKLNYSPAIYSLSEWAYNTCTRSFRNCYVGCSGSYRSYEYYDSKPSEYN